MAVVVYPWRARYFESSQNVSLIYLLEVCYCGADQRSTLLQFELLYTTHTIVKFKAHVRFIVKLRYY